jgi:hypothetical protein
MNEKRITEEIYSMLDGELSPDKQAKLEQYIREHPEAQRIYKQCKEMAKDFENSKKNAPEPDLKSEIMGRIEREKYVNAARQPVKPYTRSIWQTPVFRTSFVFACGLFVGFLVFAIFRVDFTSLNTGSQGMQGTMGSSSAFEDMKVADMISFESPEATTVCNVRYTANVIEIHLELKSETEVKSMLDFNNEHFSLINVQNEKVNEKCSALTSTNYVYINNTGENKYIIRLYNKTTHPHDIAYKLLKDGQQIFQNKITINK